MNRVFVATLGAFAMSVALASASWANTTACEIPPDVVNNLQGKLDAARDSGNGGFFTPNNMWSAIVDRKGRLCSVISNDDAWPGSRAIAIAKASTANDFSNAQLALSTANLYSLTQPGGSLYGLNNSNPFNFLFEEQGTGIGFVPGGIITFGGGVPLYADGQVIGGLGLSGDTACADHSVAFKMRRMAGLNGTPGGADADNISYLDPNEPPNGLKHPRCTTHDQIP